MSDVLVSVGRVAASAVAPGWGPLLYDTAQSLAAGPGAQQVGVRLTELQLLRSAEGAVIPRVFGTVRTGGHLIWADAAREHSYVTGGGKGTRSKSRRHFSYTISFAVAVCEGPITTIGRIWADGAVLDSSQYHWRVYTGTETQEPDSAVSSVQSDAAPAYRGLAYVVFEDFNISGFGNRIPQLNFEVFNTQSELGPKIQALALLPGGEFAHDTQLQVVQADTNQGQGQNYAANAHVEPGAADWTLSLDNMQSLCPQCQWVALRVPWFGDDLRLGHCQVQPRTETRHRETLPAASRWQVAGLTRATAPTVPQRADGSPLFPGTPSDASLLRAIADLKARGISILFYPDIVMDAPATQAEDPYGRAAPPRFAWRGEITCHPAPGRPNSADKSAAGEAQLRRFVTGRDSSGTRVNAWSLETMIVHYAKLCAAAGGVDAFLLGSELMGATRTRNASGTYPFAAHLNALAQTVRRHLPQAKLSYAAHWREYGGYKPPSQSDPLAFPLDDFWGSANADFVGIDAFVPLSDWRDEEGHIDGRMASHIGDLAYLRSNVEAGEYFTWAYRNEAERARQHRLAPHYRSGPWKNFKFFSRWWYGDHFTDHGVREHNPRLPVLESVWPKKTAWERQSKPIWFTALGCPAVDKGSNQPDAVPRPSLGDETRPHFSNGQRDDYIQRQYLRAMLSYWQEKQNTFVRLVDLNYDVNDPSFPPPPRPTKPRVRDMLPAERMFVVGWDVRPFPAFPQLEKWPDAADWATGYALNGRVSHTQLSHLLHLLSEGRIGSVRSERISPTGDDTLSGYLLDHSETAVGALRPLLRAFFLETMPQDGNFRALYRGQLPVRKIAAGDIVMDNDHAQAETHYADAASLPTALKLFYLNYEKDGSPAMAEARLEREPYAAAQIEWPLVLRPLQAQQMADKLLQEIWAARETIRLRLPPSYLGLEVGDVLQLAEKFWRILRLTDKGALEVEAVRHLPHLYEREPGEAFVQRQLERKAEAPSAQDAPPADQGAVRVAGPLRLHILDLPHLGMAAAGMPLVAAATNPWPQDALIAPQPAVWATALPAPTTMGETRNILRRGPRGRWDYASALDVHMAHGELESRPLADVLGGENRAAVRTDKGWEVLQFASAELLAPRLYRLRRLLRGQYGSDAVMADELSAGAAFVLLHPSLVPLTKDLGQLQERMRLRYGEGAHEDSARFWCEQDFAPAFVGLKPLAPVHLRAQFLPDGDIRISWVRRSRVQGDRWDAPVPLGEQSESYQLTFWRGATRLRRVRATAPFYLYRRAAYLADGGDQAALELEIAQCGATQIGYSARLPLPPLTRRHT